MIKTLSKIFTVFILLCSTAFAYDDVKQVRASHILVKTRNEAIQIISEMEKIEEGLKGQNFDQLEKIVYIYGKLKSGIMYDPKYEYKSSKDIRSLRGFITKKTVCAGYAVMFKEMMDRQGIECHYVSGKTPRGGRTCLEYCNN